MKRKQLGVTFRFAATSYCFEENTVYPFKTEVEFRCTAIDSPAKFPLLLRIPSWSKGFGISVCGEEFRAEADENGLVTIERTWKEDDSVRLVLTPEVTLSVWHENSRAVERGPLVYAYPVPFKKTHLDNPSGREGAWWWEFHPEGDWNYALVNYKDALVSQKYKVEETVLENTDGWYPWTVENAPVQISTDAVKVLDRREYNGMAGPMPWTFKNKLDTSSEAEDITLVPHGCTVLRITEFPVKGEKHHARDWKK